MRYTSSQYYTNTLKWNFWFVLFFSICCSFCFLLFYEMQVELGFYDVSTVTFPQQVTIQVFRLYFKSPSQPPVFFPTKRASVLGKIQQFWKHKLEYASIRTYFVWLTMMDCSTGVWLTHYRTFNGPQTLSASWRFRRFNSGLWRVDPLWVCDSNGCGLKGSGSGWKQGNVFLFMLSGHCTCSETNVTRKV